MVESGNEVFFLINNHSNSLPMNWNGNDKLSCSGFLLSLIRVENYIIYHLQSETTCCAASETLEWIRIEFTKHSYKKYEHGYIIYKNHPLAKLLVLFEKREIMVKCG